MLRGETWDSAARLENCAGRGRYPARQMETKVTGRIRGRRRREDGRSRTCTFGHVRRGGWEGARERTKEKARNAEKERGAPRSLKAKWPGCATCITISLGKS